MGKRNSGIIHLLPIIIIGVLALALFVFVKESQTPQLLDSEASATEPVSRVLRTDNNKVVDFSISPNKVSDFPIANPNNSSLAFECSGSDNSNSEWHIRQWNNTKSLCLDSNIGLNSTLENQLCSDANAARSSETARYCYWKDQQKFDLSMNVSAMTRRGCTNSSSFNGLYSNYLTWYPVTRPDYESSDIYNLGNISKLIISANVETKYFDSKPCAGRTATNPLDAAATTYLNVAFKERNIENPKPMYYSVAIFDNRADRLTPTSISKMCGTNNSTEAMVISESAASVGLPIAYASNTNANGGEKEFRIDVLPRIKHYLQECNKPSNLSRYQITEVKFGNELVNGADITTLITDPHIRFVKD